MCAGHLHARNAATHAFIEKLGKQSQLLSLQDVKQLQKGLLPNPTGLYQTAATRYIPPIMKAIESVALLEPYVTQEEREMIAPERVLFLLEPDSSIRTGMPNSRVDSL